jgi:hypothetical protein
MEDFRRISKYQNNTVIDIDLKPFANRGYSDKGHNLGWANEGDNDLAELPLGDLIFGGVPFKVPLPDKDNKAIICMNNSRDEDVLPDRIDNISVGAKCKTINFLHSVSKSKVTSGMHVGNYIVHYTDGSEQVIRVTCGDNIVSWWEPESMNRAIVVWKGKNKKIKESNAEVGISLFQWENPYPDKKIDTISIHTEAKTSWLVLAVNAVKYQEDVENNTSEWLSLKEQIQSVRKDFDSAWRKEENALRGFISDELIDYYGKIYYEPVKENLRTALIL